MQRTAHDGFKLPRYFEKVAKSEETEKKPDARYAYLLGGR